MKIILIQPNSITFRGILTPPLALLCVGETARQHGHEVKILDRNIDHHTKRLIKEYDPDVVGISVFTGPLIKDAVKISKFVKTHTSGKAKVVWGGIHPSLLPEETALSDFIDYIVIGEGEQTFAELLDVLESGQSPKSVKGICYKENGRIARTGCREFMDLDEAPFINWDLINAKRYLDLEIVMVSSRGCPYNCYFCYNQEFNRRKWRAQSAGRVLEEIKRVEKITGNRNLKFHDDNFTVDKQRVIKILDGLSRDYSLYLETRPDHIDKNFLDALKKFKRVWLFIGVESGSEALLKSMNKMISLDMLRKSFKLMESYRNIFTTASVILGLPGESYRQSMETVAFAKSLKPTWITYCIFTPYPGSYYYNDLVKKGTVKPPSDVLGWANYAPSIGEQHLENVDLLKVQAKELKRLDLESWTQVLLNTLLKRDFHKIYRFFKDKALRIPLKFYSSLGSD